MNLRPQLTLTWLLLLLATAITWWLGERDSTSRYSVTLTLLAIAGLKSYGVIQNFMGLRHAGMLWRGLMLGWLWLVLSLIAIAFWIGATP
jgi:hypothetical protein